MCHLFDSKRWHASFLSYEHQRECAFCCHEMVSSKRPLFVTCVFRLWMYLLSFKSMSSPCVRKAMCLPQCCFVCCDIAGSFYMGGIKLFCTLLSTKENIGVTINCFTGQPNQSTQTLLYWCRITRDHHRIEISYPFHGSKMHGSFKEAKNISYFFQTWTTLSEYLCCFVCCPLKTLDIPNF